MKKSIILAGLVVSACTTAKGVHLPDGAQGYSISCGGKLNSFAGCVEKAGEICAEKGYDIIDRSGEVIPYSTTSADFGSYSGSLRSEQGAFVNRDLLIKCRK